MRESVVHGQHGHSQSVRVECEVSRCSAVLLFLLKLLLFNSCCSGFTAAEMFEVAALKAADGILLRLSMFRLLNISILKLFKLLMLQLLKLLIQQHLKLWSLQLQRRLMLQPLKLLMLILIKALDSAAAEALDVAVG